MKKKFLKEFQKDREKIKSEIYSKISTIFKEIEGEKFDSSQLEDFIGLHYDFLDKNLEGIDPKILEKKWQKFKISLDESIKKVLRESNEMEELDKESLFQDLANISGNLSDCFSSLYTYKFQYINNPNWKEALTKLRIGISDNLNRTMSLMSEIGLQNDIPNEE